VSRVGGAAQIKAMKSVVGTLKIDLAQFRELEAFATFGSELDKASQAQLDRGYRLTELLKQGLNVPLPVQEQVVVIYAGVRGHIDDVPVEEVQRFESELRAFMRARHADMLEQIASTGALPNEGDLEAAIVEFKRGFGPSDASPAAGAAGAGGPVAPGTAAPAEATASAVSENGAE
jgi:F-type H+-transporting ATPase subunit alpha